MNMTATVKHEQFFEQDLLYKLKSTGNLKRRGEEQLFHQYFYFIKVGLKKYSLTEENVCDAYTDSVLAAIESICKGSFQAKSSLKTFLYQIFHNKCVDVLRKKATHRGRAHQTTDIGRVQMNLLDNSETIIEHLVQKADADLVKRKLKQLPGRSQLLLLLSADGYTDEEIAVEMNFKTRHVVKTSRLRCIRALRQLSKAS